MRLFKLGVYYSVYLRQFYADRPALAAEPYAIQHRALIADRVASSDFWTSALSKLGYETCDTIANAEPLQRRWAADHGVPFNDQFLFEITRAQVLAFEPDILLVADYSHFGPSFLQELRERCKSIRLIVGWCGAPYPDLKVMRAWDVALSCIPEMVDEFRANGVDAHHVNHGFEAGVLQQLRPRSSTPVPFTFLGSITKVSRFHEERERIIRSLVKATPLAIWSDVPPPLPDITAGVRLRQVAYDAVAVARSAGIPEGALRRTPVVQRVAQWNTKPGTDPGGIDGCIRQRAQPPLFGLPMFQQLRDSDVTLNTHIDVSPRSASNMRLFEGTGAGACVLTDWKENIRDLFEPDLEVVTYRTPDEAVEKYRYLEQHPAHRAAIALAGQRRTFQDHSFHQRARRIDEIIRQRLGGAVS